jgi:hypothetical protein
MCVPAWLLPVFLKAWESATLDNLNKIKVRETKSTTFTHYLILPGGMEARVYCCVFLFRNILKTDLTFVH